MLPNCASPHIDQEREWILCEGPYFSKAVLIQNIKDKAVATAEASQWKLGASTEQK
jgi:hypothetical protein